MEEKEINKDEETVKTDEMSAEQPSDNVTDENEVEVTSDEEAQEEKDPLEAAQEQIADLKDKYLRQVAGSAP